MSSPADQPFPNYLSTSARWGSSVGLVTTTLAIALVWGTVVVPSTGLAQVTTATEPQTVPFSAVATARLNVRSGPGLNTQVIARLPPGSPLSIQDTRSGWFRIASGNTTGWVSAEYVQLTPARSVDTQQLAAQPTAPYRGRTTSTLNLRAGPSLAAQRLAFLPPRRELTVVESLEGWLRVESEELRGWVAAEYISPLAQDVTEGSQAAAVAQPANSTIAPARSRPDPVAHPASDPLIVENSRLAQELAESQARLRLLQSDQHDQQAQTQRAASLLETIDDLAGELNEATEFTANLEAEIEALQSDSKSKSQVRQMRSDLKTQRRQIEELQKTNNGLQSDREQASRVLATAIEAERKQAAQALATAVATARQQALNEQTAQTQDQTADQLRIAELERELNASKEKRNRSEERRLRKQVDALSRQHEQMESRLQALAQNRDTLTARNRELEAQLVRVAEELNAAQIDIEGANVTLRSLQTENGELRGALSQAGSRDSLPAREVEDPSNAPPLAPLPLSAEESIAGNGQGSPGGFAPAEETSTTTPTRPARVASTPARIEGAANPITTLPGAVERWRAAWSRGNVTEYLAAYSPRFLPEGMTLNVWKQRRTQRLRARGTVQISLGPLRIQDLGEGRATASFLQGYSSTAFSDRVQKTLTFSLDSGDNWLIIAETSAAP